MRSILIYLRPTVYLRIPCIYLTTYKQCVYSQAYNTRAHCDRIHRGHIINTFRPSMSVTRQMLLSVSVTRSYKHNISVMMIVETHAHKYIYIKYYTIKSSILRQTLWVLIVPNRLADHRIFFILLEILKTYLESQYNYIWCKIWHNMHIDYINCN